MKKFLFSLAILATSIITSSFANASTVDISSAQNTAIACYSTHSNTASCVNALKIVNSWKQSKNSPLITVNQNILIKCLYSATPHAPACLKAAAYISNYENGAAKVAQAKSDVHEMAVTLSTGIGTGDLTTSDNTGKTALKGSVTTQMGVVPVGKVTAYINFNVGKFCVSETVGSATYRVTENSSIDFGKPCKSANG